MFEKIESTQSLFLLARNILLSGVLLILFSCTPQPVRIDKELVRQLTPLNESDIKAGDILLMSVKHHQQDGVTDYFDPVAMIISRKVLIYSTDTNGISVNSVHRYLKSNASTKLIVVRNKNPNVAKGAAKFVGTAMRINKHNHNLSDSIKEATKTLSDKKLQKQEDLNAILQGDGSENISLTQMIAYSYLFTYNKNNIDIDISNYHNLLDFRSSNPKHFYIVGIIDESKE